MFLLHEFSFVSVLLKRLGREVCCLLGSVKLVFIYLFISLHVLIFSSFFASVTSCPASPSVTSLYLFLSLSLPVFPSVFYLGSPGFL